MLDPACGSGNFLYLALHALKDIEHRVQLEAETLGLARGFPAVGPANVKGIEINAYAAELARVSVWIGEIQWMRRNGFSNSTNPILDPPGYHRMPRRDPRAGRQRTRLARGRCRNRQSAVSRRQAADRRAGGGLRRPDVRQVEGPRAARGRSRLLLVREGGPASRIGQGDARRTRCDQLDTRRCKPPSLAGRDPRSSDLRCLVGRAVGDRRRGGAGVAGLLLGAGDAYRPKTRMDGEPADEIHSDLTVRRGASGIDLTRAIRTPENIGVAFMGDTKGGPFDIPGDLAREWLSLPANPNGRPNADVLKPWVNGMDLTRRPAGKWIVDFGWSMTEAGAALYEAPFAHVKEHVWPMRQRNRREAYRVNWWRHVEPRQGMWRALDGLPRFIATPTVSKHRLFVWLDAGVCPRPSVDRHRPRRRRHLRHSAQSLPRGLVAPARDMARKGQRSAVHANHHLRDLPLSGRALTRCPCRPVCRGPARRRHRQSCTTAGGTPEPLAQPARMGRVGGRAGAGLSEVPRSPTTRRRRRNLRPGR